MARDIEKAVSRFAATLDDDSVDYDAKLKVLRTLSEVTLTLSELSNSGVGKAVRRLKSEPGELGERARNLVIKWKALLDEHIKRENIKLPEVLMKQHHHKLERTSKLDQKFELPALTVPKARKRHSSPEPLSPSLDSSSGLSFEQAMALSASVKKKPKKHRKAEPHRLIDDKVRVKSPSRSFTEEIISSLSIPIDRPDVQHPAPVPKPRDPSTTSVLDMPDNDGDLKFRSKKVIWAPRPRRSHTANGVGGDGGAASQEAGGLTTVPTLVEACLAVLAKNISMVDHVGNLPYELFRTALKEATADDLFRIEHFNPRFCGLSEELWRKQVQRRFPAETRAGCRPRSGETWKQMYTRLSKETSRRLSKIINRATSKKNAELEAQRKTRITDVITPTAVQRRAARALNGGGSSHSRSHGRAPASSGGPMPIFRPRNMSYPTPPPLLSAADAQTTASRLSPAVVSRPSSSGSMLQKLRRQFLRGR